MLASFGKRLVKMPEKQAIFLSLVIACAISGSVSMYQYATWKKGPTFSKEWKAAEIQYMKKNNMNPIFGINLILFLSPF